MLTLLIAKFWPKTVTYSSFLNSRISGIKVPNHKSISQWLLIRFRWLRLFNSLSKILQVMISYRSCLFCLSKKQRRIPFQTWIVSVKQTNWVQVMQISNKFCLTGRSLMIVSRKILVTQNFHSIVLPDISSNKMVASDLTNFLLSKRLTLLHQICLETYRELR
jgi:hypothetical protein